MDPLFSEGEISKASAKLKDGKATKDGVHAEFINHSSSNVHAQIADLLNRTSESLKPENIQMTFGMAYLTLCSNHQKRTNE